MKELQVFAYHGKHGNKFVSFDEHELNEHPRLTTDEVFRTSYVDRVIDESTQTGQVKTSGQFQNFTWAERKRLCIAKLEKLIESLNADEWELDHDVVPGNPKCWIPEGCHGHQMMFIADNGDLGKRRYVMAFWRIPEDVFNGKNGKTITDDQ